MPTDTSELEALVRKFSRLVRSAAGRVGGLRGSQIADDVEQQVFLNVWKQLEREQVITNPSSYIYRCAVRETIRLLGATREEERPMDEVAADAVLTDAPSPERAVFARAQGRKISEALKSLAVDRRRAAQAYLAGYSVPEVMQMYGWSYDRARNLSARGMADLRAALRERGVDG